MVAGAARAPAGDGALEALLLDLYARERRFVALHPDATRGALDALGRPESRYPAVQIAGTNGKGSVSAMVAAGVAAAGLRAGLFTSPHLVDWRERIRLVGPGARSEWIGRGPALEAIRRAMDAAPAPLTFFEVTTAAALVEFARREVDLAVLEVGLGGRLDATTAVTPVAGAIVTIGRDHTEVLGDSLAAIAREKAGICKPGMPVISGVGVGAATGAGTGVRVGVGTGASASASGDAAAASGAQSALCSEIQARGGHLAQLGRDFRYETAWDGAILYEGPRWRFARLPVAMAGAHQRHNAAVAVRLLEEVATLLPGLGLDARRAGVAAAAAAARWPGRFEVIARAPGSLVPDEADGEGAAPWPEGPAVVLDAAHNPDGAAALAATLRERLAAGPRRVHLVTGAMADKDAGGLLAPLLPLADEATFVRAPGKRAHDPAALARLAASLRAGLLARSAGEAAPERVALDVLRAAGEDDLIVVAGSIYLLGAVRPALRSALGLPPD